MEDILCDISAFRFHRTPPQVLMLCPPYPDRATDNNRAGFRNHILTHEILGIPVHLLATDRKRRLNNVSTVSHLVQTSCHLGAYSKLTSVFQRQVLSIHYLILPRMLTKTTLLWRCTNSAARFQYFGRAQLLKRFSTASTLPSCFPGHSGGGESKALRGERPTFGDANPLLNWANWDSSPTP